MSFYLTPGNVRVPSQGDFSKYLPLVEVFEEQTLAQDLEDAINLFFLGLPIALGDDMPVIHSVLYQTETKGTDIVHSAMVFYARVGPGGPNP